MALILVIAGCSVYKSAVRKDFETQSSGRVSAAKITDCTLQDPLTAWMARQFPTAPAELLHSSENYEIWKQLHTDGSYTLRSYRTTATGVEVCSKEETL